MRKPPRARGKLRSSNPTPRNPGHAKPWLTTGPNVALLQQDCAATDRPVVASGGMWTLADLRALTTLAADGAECVTVGKALFAGAFALADALDAVR